MATVSEGLVQLRNAVRADLLLLEAGDRIIIACSGGADSVALAYALSLEAPKLALSITAVTIDHGLQPHSEEVASACVKLLATFNIPTEIIRVKVAGAGGIEAAARNARYAALTAHAEKIGAAAIYLAHSLDDQAESVLLGLARGSGPRSIAGMSAVNGIYRRPALSLRRLQLRTVAAEIITAGVSAAEVGEIFEDPMNTDLHFLRVKIRHELLPAMEEALGGGVSEALARTALLIQEDLAALDSWAAEHLAGNPDLEVATLAARPKAIRTRVLRLALLAAGLDGGLLTFDQLERGDQLLVDWRGQGEIALPGGLSLARKSGRLILSPPKAGK